MNPVLPGNADGSDRNSTKSVIGQGSSKTPTKFALTFSALVRLYCKGK